MRSRKTDDRSQRTEVRGQRTEVRGQKTEDRGQKTDGWLLVRNGIRFWNSDVGMRNSKRKKNG